MRIIKFRVWNNKIKSWVHGPHEKPDLDGVNLFGETILLGAFMPIHLEELNDCVPLQYTGLKDKNGKEIFEGDIIRFSDYNPESTSSHALAIVNYKYASFGYTDTYTKRFYGLYDLIGEGETDTEAEIIGNIYDNPDLIK